MTEADFQRTVIDMAPPATVDLWIPGQPVPKARARIVNGHAYTPRRTLDAEDVIAWAMLARRNRPLERQLRVQVGFWRKGRRKADLDNLLKLVMDAANGVLWRDDSQVVDVAAQVFYESDNPGTRLYVWELR